MIERMLETARFADFRERLLTLRDARRQLALQDFRAPSPADVCALLFEQLAEMQVWLMGVETDQLVTDGLGTDDKRRAL